MSKCRKLQANFDAGLKVTQKSVNAVLALAGLHIGKGNTKIGKIFNISVAPMVTCSAQACATCGRTNCYACNSYGRFPNTKYAWDDNTYLCLFRLDEMKELLHLWFCVFHPAFFRVHVGGDFATVDYAEMWYDIAAAHKDTVFLAFTKQFDIIRNVNFFELDNFSLRLSEWVGCPVPADLAEKYPVAYVNDGTRSASYFPADVYVCPGSCKDCMVCFGNSVKSTVFDLHGSKISDDVLALVWAVSNTILGNQGISREMSKHAKAVIRRVERARKRLEKKAA